MVSVSVTVCHDERQQSAVGAGQPLVDEAIDQRGDGDLSGPGIEQQSPLAAKDEIQERLLEVGTGRLTDD